MDLPTTVTSPDAFDATIAVSPVSPVSPSSGATPVSAPGATLPRSTVLPRVEMVGAEARLVIEGQARYETRCRLGEGGLGEVLGARDNDIGREVAVKRIRASVKSNAVLARFAEEVRTIGRLEHPNIVPIHDVGVDENGDYYFVMKYVEGETLESIIDKLAAGDAAAHARFGFERRVEIFRALLEAVAFAHSKGIVHRDIKPANVMIGAYGEVVLMDWGIAKRLRASEAPLPAIERAASGTERRGALFETQVGELVGTPAYMSPEQSRGEAIDERSDIYSLSILFHELLTLRHPLAEKQTLHAMIHAISHEPTPMAGMVSSPHQASPPMDLSWFLRKGCAKHPANRYQSAQEMIERLEKRADGIIPIQCHITFMKRVSTAWLRFVDRHPMIVTLLMVAVLGLAITGAVSALGHLR